MVGCGGGGLVAGIAAAVKLGKYPKKPKVIAVEPVCVENVEMF